MKQLFETAEEKDQFMGTDMERITDLSIQEKMSILSSLTTLTIDIQKILQSWTTFQHQLAVTVKQLSKSVWRKDQQSDFTAHEDQAQK